MNEKSLDSPTRCAEVLQICEEMFLKKSSIFSSFWTIIAVAVLLFGGAVAWAISTSSDLSSTKTKVENIYERVTKLEAIRSDVDTVKILLREQIRLAKLNRIASGQEH